MLCPSRDYGFAKRGGFGMEDLLVLFLFRQRYCEDIFGTSHQTFSVQVIARRCEACLSVVVHSKETNVHHIHEAVPEATNLSATCLSVTKRLKLEDAFCDSGEEIFDLNFTPTVHLPRLNEFLS